MHSLRKSGQLAFETPRYAYLLGNGSRRAFSLSSPRFRGALPVFREPSSPNLSQLLANFNSKVLLPAHLTKQQQKLVYSQESRAKLEAEPVEITLGDVTLPLEHLDRNKLPDRTRTYRTIIKESKTPEDWENVLRCLEGLKEASLKITMHTKEHVARVLNQAGMYRILLKGLQRVKQTDLSMKYWLVTRQVLRGLHDRAASTGWDEQETAQAFKMATQVIDLMNMDQHCGLVEEEYDHRGRPEVIAVPTELAAVMAERHGGDIEEVKKLCKRLVAALEQTNYMETLDKISKLPQQEPAEKKSQQSAFVGDYVYKLMSQIWVWNALSTSRRVLGADMPKADVALGFEQRTEAVLNEGIDNLDKLLTYNGERLEFKLAGYIQSALEQCKAPA
ncbi:hypothetical protein A1F94_012462 [Pyrenophora tritici-repentis]|uniref:Uncharacterized protein n=3 Tax=Pyrenophora tritici-repentis TaxID=45151 RepID=A0A2W1EEK6_9PLEO|nr:uncharacterized protein PTRG_09439 [Pyrenophora tritici-repentis Pt-1C-BFP]KAA8617702.1 hypothetical protein PtrV1_09209 [Pyrenophora tritici-repentis]EDU42490.1 hypothetical protein PTRG_09439 [Pyrenophora tritici-repentis Pt-1C-BFP]KAG9376862.1 hypothetical protein A1F94_012462 [Pyrenophora tritici-repentis]KAI0573155.1 hypothetical protein Alg215_09358 [Pyrenophora tritici-repentis]KAI1512171.1 hypothetical protein Ptr86124_009011 [Pyrenophora tritici-repentis]